MDPHWVKKNSTGMNRKEEGVFMYYEINRIGELPQEEKVLSLPLASPTRPAPAESPRVGTQQGYVVVAVRCR